MAGATEIMLEHSETDPRLPAKRGLSSDVESSSTRVCVYSSDDKRLRIDSERTSEDRAKSHEPEPNLLISSCIYGCTQVPKLQVGATTSMSHPASTPSEDLSFPAQPSGPPALENDTVPPEDLDTTPVPTPTQIPQKQNTRRQYTFHIGASWAEKKPGRNQLPSDSDTAIGSWRDHMLTRMFAGSNVSSQGCHPGEDFFFVQQMRNQSGISFGVADGVGGWYALGVDPSLFSQALMYHAHRHLGSAWAGEPETDRDIDDEETEGREMTPFECLDLAYRDVLQEEHVQAGSSTACIITLNASSGILRSANLGDSGYVIIRSNAIFYQSPLQTHCFNCPKQLAKRTCGFDDLPKDADRHEVKLRDGDIVVVYTDGLSDNVFPSEMVTTICSLARAGGTEDEQVQDMADRMVEYAQQCMANTTRVSPFYEDQARRWTFGGKATSGGKVDDVTVIVGLVRETS